MSQSRMSRTARRFVLAPDGLESRLALDGAVAEPLTGLVALYESPLTGPSTSPQPFPIAPTRPPESNAPPLYDAPGVPLFPLLNPQTNPDAPPLPGPATDPSFVGPPAPPALTPVVPAPDPGGDTLLQDVGIDKVVRDLVNSVNQTTVDAFWAWVSGPIGKVVPAPDVTTP